MQDENLWIKEITQGSETALKKLYDSYSTKVFNTVLSYTKNREDAEELLQDIFVTIYNSASTFRKDASVSTWIYRIAVNKSLDFLRKKNSQKRFGLFTSLYKKDSGELAIEQTDFIHPGIKIEQKEDARFLFQVIDTRTELLGFMATDVLGKTYPNRISGPWDQVPDRRFCVDSRP